MSKIFKVVKIIQNRAVYFLCCTFIKVQYKDYVNVYENSWDNNEGFFMASSVYPKSF